MDQGSGHVAGQVPIGPGTARPHRSPGTMSPSCSTDQIWIQSARDLDHLSEVQVKTEFSQQAPRSESFFQAPDQRGQQSLWWVKGGQIERCDQERFSLRWRRHYEVSWH